MKVGDLVTRKHVDGLIGIVVKEVPSPTGMLIFDVLILGSVLTETGTYSGIHTFGRSQLEAVK